MTSRDAERQQDTRLRSNGKEATAPREAETAAERAGSEPRRLFAELLGTFALTLVAAGGEVSQVISGGAVSEAAKVVAPGLLVMGLIYAIGDVSGAHFNPAVTLAFATRGVFRWRRVPAYWMVQVGGALLAAGLLRTLFGLAGQVGASRPHHGMLPALVMETVLTCLLLTVILGTATGHRIIGHNAGVAVGGTIALCGLFAYPMSSASMNPARSLGPALVSGTLDSVWIYISGPCAGALLAVLVAWLLHGPPDQHEATTASGDGA